MENEEMKNEEVKPRRRKKSSGDSDLNKEIKRLKKALESLKMEGEGVRKVDVYKFNLRLNALINGGL